MQYISSDTNVWIDFATIDKTSLPFRLPYVFIMGKEAIEDEILSPPGLAHELVKNGLVAIEMTIEEFLLAEQYGSKYNRLSVNDCIALSVAKNRNIILLTGDGSLRNAARQENVEVVGTLWVLDQLYEMNIIAQKEYKDCLQSLLKNNGGKIRLPNSEILMRLKEV